MTAAALQQYQCDYLVMDKYKLSSIHKASNSSQQTSLLSISVRDQFPSQQQIVSVPNDGVMIVLAS